MKKYVLAKIALLTLGLVIVCGIVVFGILSVALPGAMAGWFEKTGSYSIAASYASLNYRYTGDVADAARCAQDSILSGDEEKIINSGTELIGHEDFGSYCTAQDEYYLENYGVTYSYRQYIYGEISSAYYASGETERAVGCAIEALDPDYDRNGYSYADAGVYNIDGFAYGNALITLSVKVVAANDGDAAQMVYAVLENVTAADSDELKYLGDVMQMVAAVLGS